MRTILVFSACLVALLGPAAAQHLTFRQPPGALAPAYGPRPQTDADIARLEAERSTARQTARDDLASRIGIAKGRAELFEYRFGGVAGSGASGSVGPRGVVLELRW